MNQKTKMRFAVFILIFCFIGLMISHLSPTPDNKRESSTQIETRLLDIMFTVALYYFSLKNEQKKEDDILKGITTEKSIELKETTTEPKKDE